MGINVDWKAIRPINGSRQEGFEKLCCQLANAERPANVAFIPKGTPDAGVECYIILEDGSEWGWQAKYFDNLGDSQWSQLDESVKTALDKHPKLVRYYVCIPLDLPDARIEGRRSAKDRWDDRVDKWSAWAREREMDVEFVLWGAYALLERLSNPEFLGRLRFWFDIHGFDQAWFSGRLEEAIRAAGPRYTPEVHVELPIAAKFQALGRTNRCIDSLKALARPVREKVGRLKSIPGRGASLFDIERDGKAISPRTDELTGQLRAVADPIHRVLSGLNKKFDPIGPVPFQQLAREVDVALAASDALEQTLRVLEKAAEEQRPKTKTGVPTSNYHLNPFSDGRRYLYELTRALSEFRDALDDAGTFAGARLMLLTGRAGTGKTHLLCDIAQTRIQEGRPTVLLMGQLFLSKDSPWIQVLQLLDLAHLSAEEFVGALDAAAQIAGCRALVIIDALNEGAGRQIWPEHLASFLAQLERSEWISVVLSVRSSYEEIVIPSDVRDRTVRTEHYGFVDREYDATRTFFDHYGIERPSTPLLVPEFQNPLFLKVLCRGLSESGQNRLPRGFHGISATFDIFLNAVNERLAKALSYNHKHNLVRRAVELLAGAFKERGERWLPVTEAEAIINDLLPNRDFDRSLYCGLVSEGVIIEERVSRQGGSNEEVVLVAYDRLSDHLVAKRILDLHLDPENLDAAFRGDGPLAYLGSRDEWISSGLLEAFCIQVPEKTGKDLPELVPMILRRWGFAEAFRQSLVWRAPNAISKATVKIFRRITRSQRDLDSLLDVLVTLAVVPDHPLNALYLHERLRLRKMPDRDAGWSIFLHRTWGDRGAVDRLVDWAWSITPKAPLADDSVDLCAITLAWMLTTSNRFLRDRATKALVSLLTARLPAVIRLVKRFADVDDPYVTERVYAVAYGSAMRSNDSKEVGDLAKVIYELVFKEGSPPPHILLRDYARGVIERAIYLGSVLDIELERVCPPYHGVWPHIPTKEEIEPWEPDWSAGSHDSGKVEWARNRIWGSVFHDDFARYVIGTNSWHTNWLSLRFGEPPWQSLDERLASIIGEFSTEEKAAWEAYELADRAFRGGFHSNVINLVKTNLEDDLKDEDITGPDSRLQELEEVRDKTRADLFATLIPENANRLEAILAARESGSESYPPKFDLHLIQRYILWRVFDLGWTTERFGHFDRHDTEYIGRDATKVERIGKKYQWIAYHEILALVADHFQYRDSAGGSRGSHTYEGPWQESLRDIDPSCTLRKKPGGTSWEGHVSSWWSPWTYGDWEKDHDDELWVRETNDLPRVEDLLVATNPEDGSTWIVLDAFLRWKQPATPDYDPYELDRREIWFILHGYIVRKSDAEAFMAWAEKVDFRALRMPEPPRRYEIFLGEHVWSSAAGYFQGAYYGDQDWVHPEQGCPVPIQVAGFEYLKESSGFDCSINEGYTINLPSREIIRLLGLHWSGEAGDYVDADGRLCAFDPAAHDAGPNSFLVRHDILELTLQREGLCLCWTVIGQKWVVPGRYREHAFHSKRMSGAYVLKGNAPFGFLKCGLEEKLAGKDNASPSKPVTL